MSTATVSRLLPKWTQTQKTSSSSKVAPDNGRDEDWYIPYNGPYEAPPSSRDSGESERARWRKRDSWGDLVDEYGSGPVSGGRVNTNGNGDGGNGRGRDSGYGELEGIGRPSGDAYDELDDQELHARYGYRSTNNSNMSSMYTDSPTSSTRKFHWPLRRSDSNSNQSHSRQHAYMNTNVGVRDDRDYEEENQYGRSMMATTRDPERERGRTFSGPNSVLSGRTMSSGAVDPNRTPFNTSRLPNDNPIQRRSTVSSTQRPSYVNPDLMGGVGESPAPPSLRNNHRHGHGEGNRISLASLLSFTGSVRKATSSPLLSAVGVGRKNTASSGVSSTSGSKPQAQTSGRKAFQTHRYTRSQNSSLDSHLSASQTRFSSKLRHQHQHQEPNTNQNPVETLSILASTTSTTAEDTSDSYYNSYYSTLAPHIHQASSHPAHVTHTAQPISPTATTTTTVSRQNSASTTSNSNSASAAHHQHPYASAGNGVVRKEKIIAVPASTVIGTVTKSPTSADAVNSQSTFPRLQRGDNSKYTVQTQTQDNSGRSLRNSTSTPNLPSASAYTYTYPSASQALSSLQPPLTATIIPTSNQLQPPTMKVTDTSTRQPSQPSQPFTLPFKDRWLSAETWCDALLFPRPRLKVKQQAIEGPLLPSSRRIVSPPGSPVDVVSDNAKKDKEHVQSFASRVLAHSRSMVDLGNTNSKEEQGSYYADPINAYTLVTPTPAPAGTVGLTSSAVGAGAGGGIGGGSAGAGSTLRPPRPKSFARDDLALLVSSSSVGPSLVDVLQDQALLTSQRLQWQKQALKSFGNKRARSLSRTRAKSLTQKGRQQMMFGSTSGSKLGASSVPDPASGSVQGVSMDKEKERRLRVQGPRQAKGHGKQSSLEFLAARACLGAQELTPTITPSFYFQPHALARTVEKGKGRERERIHDGRPDLESALKRNEPTKVIKLVDPAMTPIPVSVDHSHTSHTRSDSNPNSNDHGHGHATPIHKQSQRLTPSPAFSSVEGGGHISSSGHGNNGVKVGIALGTPPPEVDEVGGEYNKENIYRVNHPYAHGGLSFVQGVNTGGDGENDKGKVVNEEGAGGSRTRTTDYAGPHPSIMNTTALGYGLGYGSKHKLPPHIMLHPYALAQVQEGALATLSPTTAVPTSIGMTNGPAPGPGLGIRDSYLEQHGLVGQYRSVDRTPNPARMWAQLSPGVGVKEVLPEELDVYSPFTSPVPMVAGMNKEDWKEARPLTIHNTIGVGEMLVSANEMWRDDETRQQSQGSDIVIEEEELDDIELPEFGPHVYDSVRPGKQQLNTTSIKTSSSSAIPRSQPIGLLVKQGEKPSDPFTVANSQLERDIGSGHPYASSSSYSGTRVLLPPGPPPLPSSITITRAQAIDRTQSASPATSTDSSPQPLGSPNDLDSFQDLFYRPTSTSTSSARLISPYTHLAHPYLPHHSSHSHSHTEAALPETPMPQSRSGSMSRSTTGGGATAWEFGLGVGIGMPNRKTGSTTLTSLARELSEEFEAMALERDRLGFKLAGDEDLRMGSNRDEDRHVERGQDSVVIGLDGVRSGSMASSSRQDSRSVTSGFAAGMPESIGGSSRRPTEGSLQFVFEGIPSSSSPFPLDDGDDDGVSSGISGSENYYRNRHRQHYQHHREDSVLSDPLRTFHDSPSSSPERIRLGLGLPEDVTQSSRASSFIDVDRIVEDTEGDQTARYRLGIVESVSTPPAVDVSTTSLSSVSSQHGHVTGFFDLNFDGHTPYVYQNSSLPLPSREGEARPQPSSLEPAHTDDTLPSYSNPSSTPHVPSLPSTSPTRDRVLSFLEPHPQTITHPRLSTRSSSQPTPTSVTMTDATRSSYMTTSTVFSRMSGLSDFPAPPQDHGHGTHQSSIDNVVHAGSNGNGNGTGLISTLDIAREYYIDEQEERGEDVTITAGPHDPGSGQSQQGNPSPVLYLPEEVRQGLAERVGMGGGGAHGTGGAGRRYSPEWLEDDRRRSPLLEEERDRAQEEEVGSGGLIPRKGNISPAF